MSYDDVEIEDMEWNEELQSYTYPCPCGDLFQITKEDLKLGEEIARCPSCSLYITVIYNMEDFTGDSNKGLQPSKQQPVTVSWISGLSQFLMSIFNHLQLVIVFIDIYFAYFGLIYGIFFISIVCLFIDLL